MEALLADYLTSGDVQSIDLATLHSVSKEDHLFVLGMLMHASISNNQEFAEKLLLELAEAVGTAEYPEEVRVACFAKFLREAGAFELFGLRVNQEAVVRWLSLIEPWLDTAAPFDSSLQALFSDSISSLITYVNRLPFTLRVLPFALKHERLLPKVREGLLKLQLADFTVLSQYETKQIAEILPTLKTACELANDLKHQTRYPLIELIWKALLYQIETRLPRNEAAINTVSRYLQQYYGLFTLTQKEAIRNVYVKAAEEAKTTPDTTVLSKLAPAAAVTQYHEEAKDSAPTVANKCREFLSALKEAKQSGYVETAPFAASWRPALFLGEGVIAHRKVQTDVIEELVSLLEGDKKRGGRVQNIWKLVIRVLNEMGFKEVEGYRDLVTAVRLYVADEESEGRGGRGGRRGRGRAPR